MSLLQLIKNLSYNSTQRRLRALWRLILLLVLMILSAGLVLSGVTALGSILVSSQTMDSFTFWENETGIVTSVVTLLATFMTMALAAKVLDRRTFTDYGFHMNRRWWLDLVFGLGLGALLMVGIFLAEWALGWIEVQGSLASPAGTSFTTAIIAMIVSFICVGIYEEMLFRGYLLRNLAEGLNFSRVDPRLALWLAWILSSLLFGFAHAGNPNATLISSINIAVAGIFLGVGFVITGELAIPIGLHIAWNFFQGNVFGFPVSGTSANTTTFIAIKQSGPVLWTGGAFGPEAGLLGLIAMAAGIFLIWVWLRRRYRQPELDSTLALYPRPQHNNSPAPPAGAATLPP